MNPLCEQVLIMVKNIVANMKLASNTTACIEEEKVVTTKPCSLLIYTLR